MILGIDYGQKYIGLALSDATNQVAARLPAIVSKDARVQQNKLLLLVEQLRVDSFLIGLPTGIQGKPTAQAQKCIQFAAELTKLTGLPHKLWEETNTSKLAQQHGFKKDKEHSEAARIMLQEYLDFLASGI